MGSVEPPRQFVGGLHKEGGDAENADRSGPGGDDRACVAVDMIGADEGRQHDGCNKIEDAEDPCKAPLSKAPACPGGELFLKSFERFSGGPRSVKARKAIPRGRDGAWVGKLAKCSVGQNRGTKEAAHAKTDLHAVVRGRDQEPNGADPLEERDEHRPLRRKIGNGIKTDGGSREGFLQAIGARLLQRKREFLRLSRARAHGEERADPKSSHHATV